MEIKQLFKKANQLKRSGKLDEAIVEYYRIIESTPSFVWTYSRLAKLLADQKELDEAGDCIKKAIAINGNIAFFYYQLSEILAEQGKINQALVYFHKFLKINKSKQIDKLKFQFPCDNKVPCDNKDSLQLERANKLILWQNLKYASKLAQENQLNQAINKYQEIIENSSDQYSEIYNQLGELFFKIGNLKQAVANFEIAIYLNPDVAWYYLNFAEAVGRWGPCVKAYRKAVKLNPVALKKYYEIIELYPSKDIKIEDPIFIVGCGHSGTSLMLALLGNHPSLYPIPYESALFLKQLSKIKDMMRNWDEECLANGKRRWVEKTPPHIFQIGKFLKIRPQSQVIIMLRDGRDVVCSLKHRPDYQKFLGCIDRWIYDNLAGLLYWEHPRVKVVKYENLVVHPEETLKDICNFLGEKYNDQILEFYKTEKRWYSEEVVQPKTIDSMTKHRQNRNWQINQPLFDGRGRWKQEMTEGEKIIFKKKAQQYLLQFGYLEDNNWQL